MAMRRSVGQYVLVGVGLDTFAFRRADVQDLVEVFELDHPQSQAFKRDQLAAAGLVDPPNLHFGVVDFERESMAEALGRLPFRLDQPALFAWLGVTMYLTLVAIESTWHSVRSVAACGIELVFDFIHRDALSRTVFSRGRNVLERAPAIGEPIITGLDPATLAAELGSTGWTLLEQLYPAEIHRRYFATRTDGYRARPMGRLACAGVV